MFPELHIPDVESQGVSQNPSFASALAKAQGLFQPVLKDATNPHFKSKFASLASIIAATREALASEGIALVQLPQLKGDRFVLTTKMLHQSGASLESDYPLTVTESSTPQQIGSAISYARRYALSSILCVASEEEDDGNAASFPHYASLIRQIDSIESAESLDALKTAYEKAVAVAERERWLTVERDALTGAKERAKVRVAPAGNGNGPSNGSRVDELKNKIAE